jgi:hypothetical protein
LPLNLPNLDDLRWIDLVEEGRALIPAYAPDWTNHNPSDPGITLMELLAYASERLMYQTNRITPQHMIEFLQLIKGEKITEKSPHELTREKRKVVRALQESTRAVTAKDFENLARTVDGMNEGDAEGRAICLPSSNLESQDPAEQNAHAPGHFTVIVIPARKSHIPTRDLLVRVKNRLEPARLLTTRIHVVGPQYVNLGVQLTLVLRRGVPADEVRNKVLDRIRTFFDPLTGGIDQNGWPLGRSVYVSELYQLLGDIEGIEFVRRSKDVAGVLMDEFFLKPPTSPSPSRLKRSLRDELEAVELLPFELIAVTVASEDIAVAFQA